jgi:hypothetical protein
VGQPGLELGSVSPELGLYQFVTDQGMSCLNAKKEQGLRGEVLGMCVWWGGWDYKPFVGEATMERAMTGN